MLTDDVFTATNPSREDARRRTARSPAGVPGEGGGMSLGWKITVIVLAAAGVVSTPLIWLLDSPDTGQLAGASVQAAVGIAALVWALFQPSGNSADDTVVRTGQSRASDGGTAITGMRRPEGRGSGSAKADTTGDATATGDGSSAVCGIDYR
ncbi:hypothetical protein [Streptomyces litchfieldiae]|uniref:Holin n=1 Tax=Streptomyces litchfieldiae TaxID=3075543 RepID=A0ABU2MZ91_9ACTN|nr:hypothetical protein [Streptomyces sp. DSM 44938]MDT0346950.1 hypothetical protein [Streptomyces sp. DSM 44938]